MKRVKGSKKKGFTLIELIVVLAIIGILAAILVPNFMGYSKKAKVTKAKANAKTVLNAINAYKADNVDSTKTDVDTWTAIPADAKTKYMSSTVDEDLAGQTTKQLQTIIDSTDLSEADAIKYTDGKKTE